MRVALVDPSLFTWPYDVELAKGLEAAGHDVAVYGPKLRRGNGLPQRRFLVSHFYPGLDASRLRYLPQPAYLLLKALSHVESMLRLVRGFHRRPPDIIHFQWTPLAVVDSRFIPACRRIAPTLLTVHDSAPFNDNPRSRIQRLDATTIMRQFDGLIVHTEAARLRLLNYGVSAARINVIPHGLLFSSVLDARTDTSEHVCAEPQDGEAVNLLLFGKIKPYKGTDILLRAVAALPGDLRRRCRLRVVGEPYMDTRPLLSLVQALGLSGQVIFDFRFVPNPEMAALFARTDIQVFPYRQIDASGVLMAAIATGQVIVASRIGLFEEILEDGRTGALVPVDDATALADALAPLIADRVRREAMRSEVCALRDRIPTWNQIASLTEQAYRRAAGGRHNG
jgi:glycosyltransferase involved in cell wall biosynthesis